MSEEEIKVGDIVRKRYGKKHIEVTFVAEKGRGYYWRLQGKYLHSGQTVQGRYLEDFVKVDENEVGEDKGMRGKLFKVIADGRFGEGLTTDNQGNYVLQMKDSSNAVQVFDPKTLELIVPFTFCVKYAGGSEQQYLGKEGILAVGDFVLEHSNNKMNFGVVTKINTKAETNKKFSGRKVLTEKVSFD